MAMEARNLGFSIGPKMLLGDVSFRLADGEFASIVGRNGAGKSTLLKCLMRILTGTTGAVTVLGRPLESYGQRELARLVSYVPQADGRPLPCTVSEFLMMARYPHLSPFTSRSRADERAVEAAMEMTGTSGFAARRMDTMSGGERQKLFIAAAVAQEPRIVLLDEPTTFLDPRHQAEILRLLRRMNRERGLAILAVTHDINAAAMLSDSVLCLKDGRVVFAGPASRLSDNALLASVFDKEFRFVPHPVTGQPVIVPDEVER
jgi:iron complex transport system ATP-binding protein